MDAVEPVNVGNPGGGPPPPGTEPVDRHVPSTQAIGAFLAPTAASIGPAAFWPAVTASVLGGFVVVLLVTGVWRPARALRHDRAAVRRAGVLLPGLASDLLSAVELAGPHPVDPRAAAVSEPLVR